MSLLRAGKHAERKLIWCKFSFEIRHHGRRENGGVCVEVGRATGEEQSKGARLRHIR